jgi:hypothetical protein
VGSSISHNPYGLPRAVIGNTIIIIITTIISVALVVIVVGRVRVVVVLLLLKVDAKCEMGRVCRMHERG